MRTMVKILLIFPFICIGASSLTDKDSESSTPHRTIIVTEEQNNFDSVYRYVPQFLNMVHDYVSENLPSETTVKICATFLLYLALDWIIFKAPNS